MMGALMELPTMVLTIMSKSVSRGRLSCRWGPSCGPGRWTSLSASPRGRSGSWCPWPRSHSSSCWCQQTWSSQSDQQSPHGRNLRNSANVCSPAGSPRSLSKSAALEALLSSLLGLAPAWLPITLFVSAVLFMVEAESLSLLSFFLTVLVCLKRNSFYFILL